MSTFGVMKSLEHLNVVICVPSTGLWVSGFGQALSIMVADFMVWRPEGCKSKYLQIFTQDSSMLVQSRQDLVKAALSAGATHVLFLDSDMVFPKDLLKTMLLHDKDVLGLNCTTRAWPPLHIAHDFMQERIDSRDRTGLEKVQQVGLAVMLVKVAVLRKLRPPIFMMEWIPATKSFCGEDIYFCQLVQDAGYDVWVDHDLSQKILHVGPMAFGSDLISVSEPVEQVLKSRGLEKKERKLEEKLEAERRRGALSGAGLLKQSGA